jgi:aminomuconate-semialdehyde/2-hydroxymuconate-6-semialdehyde dehydrogenase
VFADCDFQATVAGAVRAAFTNQGQVCLAGSRLFVEAPIYERFVAAFVEEARQLVPGDPQTANFGAVVSAQHLAKIESYVELARQSGARILLGGARPQLPPPFDKGAFYLPTVIEGLPPSHRCASEEIFGPVVTVHRFDTEAEMLTHVNGLAYGLAGSVWTSNVATAHRVAQRVESGMVWVNCWLHRDLRVPFGGVKESGTGREGGKWSLDFFSETKNICIKYA